MAHTHTHTHTTQTPIEEDGDVARYFLTVATVVLTANASVSMGYAVGALCHTPQVALAVGPALMLPLAIFGGHLMNSDAVPPYWKWLEVFSFFKYGMCGFAGASHDYLAHAHNTCTCIHTCTCTHSGFHSTMTFIFEDRQLSASSGYKHTHTHARTHTATHTRTLARTHTCTHAHGCTHTHWLRFR